MINLLIGVSGIIIVFAIAFITSEGVIKEEKKKVRKLIVNIYSI